MMGSDVTLRDEVRATLLEAGARALAYLGRAERESKPDGTPVTDADRAVEEIIVERLARAFPGESIRAEEGHHVEGPPGAPVWYVDPIDGTGAFLSELAYWGPTVCRVVDGALQAGGFYVPRLGELWYAERGGGAWRDGRRLPVLPDVPGIRNDAVLFVPSKFHRKQPVPWPGKIRALGTGAAHLAHVASGGGLATVIPRWQVWDVGCGALLIGEVGRVIWDATGAVVDPVRVPPSTPLLAGAPSALRSLTAQGWAAGALGGER
ncbi:MAG: inositol monophosphatase [Myxococcota bacterium]